jgi:hypothetical protein
VSTPDGRRSKAHLGGRLVAHTPPGIGAHDLTVGCDASDLDGYCRPFRRSYNVIIAPGHIPWGEECLPGCQGYTAGYTDLIGKGEHGLNRAVQSHSSAFEPHREPEG